jgi:signal peptidase I
MESSVKSLIREALIILFASLAVFLVLQTTIMKAEVIGESMEPNLYRGEQLVINKLAYKFGAPERGDIIVFTPPHMPEGNDYFIKRVIGLPGDKITISNGMVTVIRQDGSVISLDEPYIDELPLFNYESQTIPQDHYFVMGDNRNNSSDSRGGWTVPVENIVGKAWFSYWPFDQIGAAPNFSLPE